MTLATRKRRRVRIPELAVDPLPQPLKRPRQARSRFTVQAVYDALVRIWQRGGWAAVSTRAVALEAGYAVGTLYEWFPNREALLSGYVRHCLEARLAVLQARVIDPPALSAPERLERLVRLTLGREVDGVPWYDREMLLLEGRIAGLKQHERSFAGLCAMWAAALRQITTAPVPDAELRAWLLLLWGGRRYAVLLDWSAEAEAVWLTACIDLCRRHFLPPAMCLDARAEAFATSR